MRGCFMILVSYFRITWPSIRLTKTMAERLPGCTTIERTQRFLQEYRCCNQGLKQELPDNLHLSA